MTRQQALEIVASIATSWGENMDEAFPHRIEATDTDATLQALCSDHEGDLDDAKQLRDLWVALAIVNEMINKGVLSEAQCEALATVVGVATESADAEQARALWPALTVVEEIARGGK